MKKELADLTLDVLETARYLKELGVESIAADLPEDPKIETAPAISRDTTERAEPLAIPARKPAAPAQRSGSRLTALPSLAARSHAARSVNAAPAIARPNDPTPPSADTLVQESVGLPPATETIEEVRADIGECKRCPLWEGRTKIVHSVGNMNADLMFIGEAPGADEDQKGEPFVGRAGQLLTKMIEAIGFSREEVCIGNINRCRPPGNRPPTLPEAHTCRPFLLREIAVIRPKVIVVLGNTALHNLLETKIGITRMRGQFHDYFGIKVMPTFHPAFLLRDPNKKRDVWDDLKKVRDYLSEPSDGVLS